MVSWIKSKRCGPIGVDIGSRSIKMIQFDAAQTRVWEAARWDLPAEPALNQDRLDERIVESLRRAMEGRRFRGREAVFSLGSSNLFVQNIRVAQASGDELTKIVHFEAAGRLPYSREEAEIRYIDADTIRQGDSIRREVILMACHKPVLDRMVHVAERAGLQPMAVNPEPLAILRSYSRQLRRDEDQKRRIMYVNVGASNTLVVIACGMEAVFIKYLDIGGRLLDSAVSKHVKLSLIDAASLRSRNGDGRAGSDPEVAKSITESIRPIQDRLAHELSLCMRYYSVTFRSETLQQCLIGGGEANDALVEWLGARLDLPCELGDPLRRLEQSMPRERISQWDVAVGLAMREINNHKITRGI
jgi:type IV pilus assembly protein PilM